MRKLGYCCIIVFCALSASVFGQTDTSMKVIDYNTPTDYVIGGITVSGTKFLDPDILVTLSGLTVGEKINIPGDKISKAVRGMWEQGLFTDVKIKIVKTLGKTVFLDIELVERARLSKFEIKGVKKGDQDDLRGKIQLVAGRVVTENTKIHTANTILAFYRDKGFLTCKVNILEQPDTAKVNMVILTINIDKGKKVKIKEIAFEGVSKVSETKLKGKMKDTKEKVRFDVNGMLNPKNIKEAIDKKATKPTWDGVLENISPSRTLDYFAKYVRLNFFSGSKFIKKDYTKDKSNIVEYYNSQGYRDATILSDTVYMEDNELRIHLKVDEGKRYYFRNITWRGNTKYSDKELNGILNIHKGDVYNQGLLTERLNMSQSSQDVSSLYMDDGYLFFQINPLEVAVVDDSIDLEIRISEGPQATINEVRIMGNTKTKEYVIRRELRTLPGDKFSRTNLIRSQREIAGLGYFDQEQLEVVPIPNPEKGTVDIEYRVVEKPSDQLELSAGYGGTGRGVVGSLGVTFTNFSIQNIFKKNTWSPLPAGDGQRLSIRVQTNGQIYQSYNASFTEPWLGGKKPNSFSLSWSHVRYANLNVDNKVTGRFITNAASIGIGTRLKWPDDYFIFQAQLNYQNYTLQNWTTSNFLITDGSSNNINVKFTLSRNSVDPPQIYPRRGSNFSVSFAFTPPYSAFSKTDYSTLDVNHKYKFVEFHKWRVNAEWYTPLTRGKNPLVLKLAAKFGFLGYYNSKIGYSPFERFDVGGDGISNISLYGRDIISLRGYDVLTPTTGAPFFTKFTTEIRFPFSLNPSATIYGLVFAEGGNYFNSIKEYNPLNLNRSAGVGVRIFLPMFGLLGFDYGIGFDKKLAPTTGVGNYLGQYGKFSIILGFEPE